MKKNLKLQNKNIKYILKTSRRAKYLRLTVYCEGNLIVTRPYGLKINLVEQYIKQKASWIIQKLDFFNKINNVFLSSNTNNYLKNKERALKYITGRVEHFNEIYKFSYNRISIRNQKTRWGSCSIKGNLNFNYKIFLLPQQIADYIIVHELCHLKEFNHSRRFWNLVAEVIPDYLTIKKQLRSKGIRYY